MLDATRWLVTNREDAGAGLGTLADELDDVWWIVRKRRNRIAHTRGWIADVGEGHVVVSRRGIEISGYPNWSFITGSYWCGSVQNMLADLQLADRRSSTSCRAGSGRRDRHAGLGEDEGGRLVSAPTGSTVLWPADAAGSSPGDVAAARSVGRSEPSGDAYLRITMARDKPKRPIPSERGRPPQATLDKTRIERCTTTLSSES